MNIKTMAKIILLVWSFLSSLSLNAQEVVSPNKKIKAAVSENAAGQILFNIMYNNGAKYVEVLPNSHSGIILKDQQFADKLSLVKISGAKQIHDKYQMIAGKRKNCGNFGTEKIFSYKNYDGRPLDIIFRVYNDGIAFRYVFPNHSDSLVNITSEATTYILPDSTYHWMQPYTEAFEDFYNFSKTRIGKKKEQEWGLPALFKLNDESVWASILEADITENNCATRLCNLDSLNEYKVTYPPARKDFKQTGVVASMPWNSQWHILIIGKLSDMVESALITDLSEPNKLKNTSWIKPGPVAWIYWANNHGSKDYQKWQQR